MTNSDARAAAARADNAPATLDAFAESLHTQLPHLSFDARREVAVELPKRIAEGMTDGRDPAVLHTTEDGEIELTVITAQEIR